MHEPLLRSVVPLVGVRAESVTLRLNQIRGQAPGAVAIVIRDARAHGGRRHPPLTTPHPLSFVSPAAVKPGVPQETTDGERRGALGPGVGRALGENEKGEGVGGVFGPGTPMADIIAYLERAVHREAPGRRADDRRALRVESHGPRP